MKYIETYKKRNLHSEDEVFSYLLKNLKKTISAHDFFVAWDKVLSNTSAVEIPLNILNTLIGKNDVKKHLKEIIKKYPEVVPVLPRLIAIRKQTIQITEPHEDTDYTFFRHERYEEKEVNKIIDFAYKCGLLKIIGEKKITNLVDYYTGVEVGLDTNARKNRSGRAMENITETYIKGLCEKYNYTYLAQAKAKEIERRFGHKVPTDKVNRCFDFIIYAEDKVFLVETNYYTGGGSKLKAVAGEFQELYKRVRASENIQFIWITDGQGWETAKSPLQETFNTIDFIFNLQFIKDGALEEVLTKRL